MNKDELFTFAKGGKDDRFVWYDYKLVDGEVVIRFAGTMDFLTKNERLHFSGRDSDIAPDPQVKKALDEYLKQNGVHQCTIQMIYGVDKRAKQTFASCEADVDMTQWKSTN
jgi:hypothetical protein